MCSLVSRYWAESQGMVLSLGRALALAFVFTFLFLAMAFSSKCLRELACRSDIPALRAFVPALEQDDKCRPPLDEVDPVARTAVDPHFRNAATGWFHIAEIADFQAIDPRLDAPPRPVIAQCRKPAGEQLGLADFHRTSTVS